MRFVLKPQAVVGFTTLAHESGNKGKPPLSSNQRENATSALITTFDSVYRQMCPRGVENGVGGGARGGGLEGSHVDV